MKTFIATIGWTEWPVTSAIIKHGLSQGDRIVLLAPEKKDDRSKIAIRDVKDFISKFVSSVEVLEISVPVHNPIDGITTLGRLIKKEAQEGRELAVNLSGGMRVLVLETLLALTLLQTENLTLELQSEDKVEVQLPRVWNPAQKPLPNEEKALKVIDKLGPISLSDLAKALKLSVATVHRLLKRLEARGAIVSKKSGKERIMELTATGRILLATLIDEEI